MWLGGSLPRAIHTLAAGQVAAAEPDGYTVLMHHIGMSTAPTLYADLPYDPLEDFKMIGLVTEVPMTIIGAPDFEPDTMEELVAYVEENGDSVNYANAGIGAASQLCGLLFMSAPTRRSRRSPTTARVRPSPTSSAATSTSCAIRPRIRPSRSGPARSRRTPSPRPSGTTLCLMSRRPPRPDYPTSR